MSAALVEEYVALRGYGWDVGDILAATGASYDTMRKAVSRARPDLLGEMSAWKDAERRRQLAARGLLHR